MSPTKAPRNDDDARRKGVRRTVLLMAAVALTVYVLFILSGVMGQ